MILKAIPIVIIVAYMVVCVVVGYLVFRTKTRVQAGDYFIGDRTSGSFLGPMSYISTVFSALVFLGAVGIYFALGIGFNVFLLSEMLLLGLLVPSAGYIFWRLAHKYQYVTPADLVAHRYGDGRVIRILVALNTVGFMLFFMATQIVGIAYIMETITGGLLNYTAAVLIISVVLAFYIVLGGFRAIEYTDTIQVLMLIGCVVATFLFLSVNIGWTDVFAQAQQIRPALFKTPGPVPIYTMKLYVTQLLIIGLGFALMPQLWVRIYAVRDEKGLQNIVTYFIGATIVLFVISFFLAVAAAPIVGELFKEGEKVVPDKIVMKLMFGNLPAWLAATLLTGAVAATMSTVDSAVLAIASILTVDLYRKPFNPNMDSAKEANLGRVISVILIVIMAVLAFYPPKLLFNSLIDVAYPGLVALAPAAILGMYWRKAGPAAAVSSIVIGSVLAVLLLIFKPNPLGLYSGFWTLLVSLFIFVIVGLAAPSREETFLPDTAR
ncbi:MAG: sodium:solute symporter family protein [Thermodesulfobacteriota bacterium]